MPTSLIACPACARHLLAQEPSCPFCGESLCGEPEKAETKSGRAAAVAGIALAAAITAGSGALIATHAGITFARASTIVDLDHHAQPVDHVAVPCYGAAPPPEVPEERGADPSRAQ